MDVSALSSEDIAKMNETQLEEALDILRKGGKGSKGKKGDRSGARTPRSEDKDKDKDKRIKRQMLDLREGRAHGRSLPQRAPAEEGPQVP